MVKRYRTKPVEIEAIEFTGGNVAEVHKFVQDAGYYMEQAYADGENFLYVYSDEGRVKAPVGNYIIKGLRGEIYTSKPDVFHKKYEGM